MANTSELEKGLIELKRLTGITLAVTAEDSSLPTGKNIIKGGFLWD